MLSKLGLVAISSSCGFGAWLLPSSSSGLSLWMVLLRFQRGRLRLEQEGAPPVKLRRLRQHVMDLPAGLLGGSKDPTPIGVPALRPSPFAAPNATAAQAGAGGGRESGVKGACFGVPAGAAIG
jgi:hypothetical protein